MKSGRREDLIWILGAMLLAFSPGLQALADDASRGVPLPAPVAVPAGAVRVESSSLTITAESVTIQMHIQVSDGRSSSIRMTLPRFGWMGEAEPYPDRNFPELKFLVDDKQATVREGFRAFFGKKEITHVLEQDKLDPFVIADTPPFLVWTTGEAHSVVGVEKTGAIEKMNDRFVAKWQAQRIITLLLSPGAHELAITYKPRPAYQLRSFSDLRHSSQLLDGCLADMDLRTALGTSASVMLREYTVPAIVTGEQMPPVQAQVNLADIRPRPDLIVFCGSDSKAVTTSKGVISAAVRTDWSGNLHVFVFSKVNP